MSTRNLAPFYLGAGGVTEMLTDEGACLRPVMTSHKHLGMLLGLDIQAQTSMVLVSSGCSKLVSKHSSAQVRPISRSTSSGF